MSKRIDSLYKILTLYEDLENENSPVNLDSYLSYVDKMYVKWLGIGNEDICDMLKGLWQLGNEAGHKRVKSIVFDMIQLAQREG